MKQASLIIGIIAFVGMLIGLLPCLGWFNWLNLPLAVIGLILGIMAYSNERRLPLHDDYSNTMYRRNSVPVGLILNAVALGFGIVRLFIGGGIL